MGRKPHETESSKTTHAARAASATRGQVQDVLGVSSDISERTRVEEKLKEREAELRAMHAHAESLARFPEENPDPVLRLSQESRLIYVNHGARSLLGELGLDVGTVAPEVIALPAREALAGGKRRAVEIPCGGRWFALRFVPIGTEVNVYGRDVTERRNRDEEAQKEHRQTEIANRMLAAFVKHEGDELFDEVLAVVQEALASRHGIFGYMIEPGHLVCPSLSKMLDACEVEGKCIHYPPEKWKGLWARALTDKSSFYTNEAQPVPPGHPIIDNNLAAPILFRGEAIGLLNLANKQGGYSEEDRHMLEELAARLAPVLYAWTQRKLRDEERRQAQERLKADLDAMTRLQLVGSLFLREGNLESVLAEIVDAAMAITGADFGNIQILDPVSSDLKIAAQRGFPGWWLDFWDSVSIGKGACGTALELGERVVVEDVEKSPIFVGTPALEIQRKADVRAVQSTPLVGRSGKPLGMFSTHYRKPGRPDERALRLLDLLARQAADIIERTQIEQALRYSEESMRRVQEIAHLGSWELDLANGQLTWSDEAYRIFGHQPREPGITYQVFLERVHPEDRAAVDAAYTGSIRDGKDWYEIEHRVVRKDTGEIRHVHERCLHERGSQGKIVRSRGMTLDITERKQAEQRLIDANLQLAEADRRKNEFMAVLSHELRNPLAPITNSLYILEHAPHGGEQAERARQIIGRQVAQLSSLVNDLLDVTRIARNKVQLQKERLDMNEMVLRTVEDNRSLFERAGVDLDLLPAHRPAHVMADRTRIAQIVGNLLQNSVKFTAKGGYTRVSVAIEEPEVLVRVSDDGVGISRETLDRLFQPFMQAEQSLDRNKGGLGLGLALVKGLVELHGGSVSAHSAGLGHGTEMIIRLPLDTGGAIEAATSKANAAHARRRVLIIEDNADAAESLSAALGFGNHEVSIAHNGPDGIARARVFRPEVVLCDIGLPGMDGYEVARAFRVDKALRGVFLVALSGYALPEDLQCAAEAGFERHLAKPPNLESLEQLLAEVPRTPPRER